MNTKIGIKKVLLVSAILASQVFALTDASAQRKRNHDAISPLTFGANATLKRFLPKLNVNSACKPYTAVDRNGNFSGGLQDSGRENGKCNTSGKAQVYTRTARVNRNTHAVMYAYYFPKDNGRPVASIGHRHDWEHVFVFIENLGDIRRERVVGAAYSAHGGVSSTRSPNRDGKQIYINYEYNGSVTHSFAEGGSQGAGNRDHVLISWNKIPRAAKNTLNTYDWGSAIVPFKDGDGRFERLVWQARNSIGYP